MTKPPTRRDDHSDNSNTVTSLLLSRITIRCWDPLVQKVRTKMLTCIDLTEHVLEKFTRSVECRVLVRVG